MNDRMLVRVCKTLQVIMTMMMAVNMITMMGMIFYSFYDSDDMYANADEHEVNANVPTEVAASQVGSRRVGKEPIIEHPPEVFNISDSSDGGGNGLEDDVELNKGVRDFVEDSSDSWDDKNVADVNEPS